MRLQACFLAFGLLAAFAAPRRAAASPWTLPRGDLVLVTGYDLLWAGSEYLDSRNPRDYPLNGRLTASTFTLAARAGFTDRLELELQIPVRLVSFTSDPVILLSQENATIDFFQENILDFTATERGVGDVILAARYGLLQGSTALALEGRAKIPAGYDGPEGTFGADPETIADFDAGEAVSPENISDDVTLGSGQVDLSLNMLLGSAFASRTFIRADAGFTLRLDGAGDQVTGALKVGQAVGRRVLLFVEARGAYSVQRGRSVGVSVFALDPDLPATEYGPEGDPLFNLGLRVFPLDFDVFQVAGGAIFRFSDQVELNVAYQRVMLGRNIAQSQQLFMGVAFRRSLVD
ncbi:MAG: hypothetical protein AAF447_08345 [Myxococcota bacterium]